MLLQRSRRVGGFYLDTCLNGGVVGRFPQHSRPFGGRITVEEVSRKGLHSGSLAECLQRLLQRWVKRRGTGDR